jgi:uncharacterized protein (TIGR00369 family)
MAENNRLREEMLIEGLNGSPFYRHIGMKLKELSTEGSVMTVEADDNLKNMLGITHGGVVASLIDSSCGTSLFAHLDEHEAVVTLDLRVQYFEPVRRGTVTARGRMIHRTRRYLFAESEVTDEQGKIVARGSSIHSVVIPQDVVAGR